MEPADITILLTSDDAGRSVVFSERDIVAGALARERYLANENGEVIALRSAEYFPKEEEFPELCLLDPVVVVDEGRVVREIFRPGDCLGQTNEPTVE